jgi:hypothetical protein
MKAVPGIAGIFIRWNSTTNEGDALVLSYNSSSVQSGWTGPDWGSKIASAHGLYGPPLAVWHRWQSKIERGLRYLAACIFDSRPSL